jgi:hypothetical protein
MKKLVLVSTLLMACILATVGLASVKKVAGKVVKVEGEFVVVKDDKGEVHKFHVDKTTKQIGEIKAGSRVEVETTPQGHAAKIRAAGEEKREPDK